MDDPMASANPSLLDLTPDGLRAVLSWLTPRELSTVAHVCRRLADLSLEDHLWEAQVCAWCQNSVASLAGLSASSGPLLRAHLGLPSYRHLYQVLHQLSGWPEGLWQRVDDGARPFGELVQVKLHRCQGGVGGLLARTINPKGVAAEELFQMTVISHHRSAKVCVHAYAQRDAELKVCEGGSELVLLMPQLPHGFLHDFAAPAPGPALGVPPMLHGQAQPHQPLQSAQPADAAVGPRLGIGSLAWDHLRQRWVRMYHPMDEPAQQLRFRRIPSLPPPLPRLRSLPPAPSSAFPSEEALRRLQGLWCGIYGPHGMEILELSFVPAASELPPRCPAMQGARLQGMKITGDPNVPANQWSLITDAATVTVGPYDGSEVGNAGGPARPVVVFYEDGMNFVDLSERRVLARYDAVGQMNFVPGVWDPTWAPAQVLIYEGDKPEFSLLFEDDGEQFRHVIDFKPLIVPP